MKLLAFAGKFALFLAVMAWLTCVSVFVVGGYLASWPIMRISPRNRRLTSLVELSVALMAVVRAYKLDQLAMNSATDDPEATDNLTEGGD